MIPHRATKIHHSGIVAQQRPLIIVEEQYSETISVAPEQNTATEFTFECKDSDFELIAQGNVTISEPTQINTNKYRVKVCATTDNLSAEENTAGYITFKVGGQPLDGKIAVVQRSAILFDRSRVVINGTAGAKMNLAINTPFDFTVKSSTAALTAIRGEGQSIILTTTQSNSSNSERKLGVVTIALKDKPESNASIEVWQRKEKADHTLFFYFLGTSLKGYFQGNLSMVETIATKGTLDNCRVIVFLQNSTNSGSMFEIRHDKGTNKVLREPIADYDLPAVYNEDMLYNIFKDMFVAAPATEYGLYVGSHGRGWIPKSSTTANTTTFQTSLDDYIWTPAPGAAMVRHLGDTTSTQINTTEFASAISRTGVHLDYIIFDVCYMSNVESLYDMKSIADYILASPCEVMAAGMPYANILPTMVSTAPINERLDAAAKAFVDEYKTNKQGIYSSACSAVITCSELDALAECVKQVNRSVQDIDPETIQVYDGISSSRNPTHIFFDLEDYIVNSCTDNAAITAFQGQLSRTVFGQYHTDSFYSAYNNRNNPITSYCGLTTSAPIMLNPASAYRDQWQATAWYKATH